MSPDEVIDQLKNIGVIISRATLLRYENQELVPKPSRGGGGAGGRWTDYPPCTVEEAAAAWAFLHGEYGLPQINKEFFEGKPPKIRPSTIKFIRSKLEMKKLVEKVEKERAAGVVYPMLDELDRRRESRSKNQACIFETEEEKYVMPEWMQIYDKTVEPLLNFLIESWLYEVDQAKKKLNAI